MSPLMIESLANAQLAEHRATAMRRRQVRAASRPARGAAAPPNLLIAPSAQRSRSILSWLRLPSPV